MIRLQCPTCQAEVFFDSLSCLACGTELVLASVPGGDIVVSSVDQLMACSQRSLWWCNWPAAGYGRCRSCELVDVPEELAQVSDTRVVEWNRAQRRALRQLDLLGIPWVGSMLRFALRESADGETTMGHASGVITLVLEEADSAWRERVRTDLNELYRTPLGHVRHELGHFVWMTLVEPFGPRLTAFRRLFGDERIDYQEALETHYATTDDGDWRDRYISFYASAHPWEDFAESWAQVLHSVDVVETAVSWDVIADAPALADPESWLSAAVGATVVANELSRSMGTHDLYPFVMSAPARKKIAFCWRLTAWAP